VIKKFDMCLASLRECYYGRAGLILGSSPSIKSIKRLSFPCIKLALGDLPYRNKNLGPFDFWVSSNGYYPLPQNLRHLKHINSLCKNFLLSPACVQLNTSNMTEVLGTIENYITDSNVIIYDQRHFDKKACIPRETCCDFYNHFEVGKCIQDLLKLEVGDAESYGVSHTVAAHGFAIAVLLKLNPIFIAGVNLPTVWKEYKTYRPFKFPMGFKTLRFNIYKVRNPKKTTPFSGYAFAETLDDFSYIASVARRLGIHIYSLEKDSPINNVRGIDKISVMDANLLMHNYGQNV